MSGRHYLTPPEIVRELLAPMRLADFYAGIKPGGALDRAGFPAPVPWASGRKKRYDRAALEAWRDAVTRATLARQQVDAPGGNVVSFPARTSGPAAAPGRSGWEAWCEAQAERAAERLEEG